MKSKRLNRLAAAILLATGVAVAGGSAAGTTAEDATKLDPTAAAHLATFDDLDFNVFTGQRWDALHRSHADDIVVHWPDGHTTEGLDAHTKDLAAMFVYAPDTRIEVHPIKIGSGEWTAVTGIMEGTFTQPMPIGNGQSVAPTGKAFKIEMATFGHWNAEGVMDEEWLYWDNLTFMKQLGLAD